MKWFLFETKSPAKLILENPNSDDEFCLKMIFNSNETLLLIKKEHEHSNENLILVL